MYLQTQRDMGNVDFSWCLEVSFWANWTSTTTAAAAAPTTATATATALTISTITTNTTTTTTTTATATATADVPPMGSLAYKQTNKNTDGT